MTDVCTLVYGPDGFAWVRYGDLDAEETRPGIGTLATEDNHKSTFSTLMGAYTAAVRAGHRPTQWVNPAVGVPIRLDHADHWLRLAGLEDQP